MENDSISSSSSESKLPLIVGIVGFALGAAGLMADFAAHPQPDPAALGVAHPEAVVDVVVVAGDQPVGDGEQVDVVAVNQGADLAEGRRGPAQDFGAQSLDPHPDGPYRDR